MDILKQDGFSIIEALVGIVLLGLLSVFTIIVFNNLWNNPSLTFKGEAFSLANKEIDNSVNLNLTSDTSYFNYNNSLKIERKVELGDVLNLITVSVTHTNSNKEITALSVYLVK